MSFLKGKVNLKNGKTIDKDGKNWPIISSVLALLL